LPAKSAIAAPAMGTTVIAVRIGNPFMRGCSRRE
jgi:hypothetical protein